MTDLEAIPTDELIREMLRANEAYKWSPLFVRREVGRRLAAAEARADHLEAKYQRASLLIGDMQDEVDRLHSWSGIMWLLEKHYPSDVFTGVSGDPGAVTVVALREIDTLRTQLAVVQQGCGDMCDKCGWRCLFPGEGCVNCDCHTLRTQLAVAREGLEKVFDDYGDGAVSIAAEILDKIGWRERP